MAKFQSREEYEDWKVRRSQEIQENEKKKTDAKQILEEIKRSHEQDSQKKGTSEETSAPCYACPSCNSENIQRASVLVSLGSNRISATTVGVGVGNGGLGAGVGLTGGSTTSQLAAKLSPPTKPQQDNCRYVMVLAVPSFSLLFAVVAFSDGHIGLGVFLLCVVAFSIYPGFIKWLPSWQEKDQKQKKEYALALACWERTFFCLRCGKSFEIGGA